MTQIAKSRISATRCQVGGGTIIVKVSALICRLGLHIDQDNLRRKNEELFQTLREKSRKLLQTQELYDKLKRRALLGQAQDAIHDAMDDTIQASSAANRFVDRVGAQSQQSAPHSILQEIHGSTRSFGPPPINRGGSKDRTWSGLQSLEATRRAYHIYKFFPHSH